MKIHRYAVHILLDLTGKAEAEEAEEAEAEEAEEQDGPTKMHKSMVRSCLSIIQEGLSRALILWSPVR